MIYILGSQLGINVSEKIKDHTGWKSTRKFLSTVENKQMCGNNKKLILLVVIANSKCKKRIFKTFQINGDSPLFIIQKAVTLECLTDVPPTLINFSIFFHPWHSYSSPPFC